MPKIIRVSKKDFELDDGSIHVLPFELDEVPSIKDFQTLYDNSKNIIEELLKQNERIANSKPSSQKTRDNNNNS